MMGRRAVLRTLGAVGATALAGYSSRWNDRSQHTGSADTSGGRSPMTTEVDDDTLDRVREVALEVRPAIVALQRRTRVAGAGWYAADGVVATAASVLGTTSAGAVAGSVIEPDGTERRATIVAAPNGESDADVAVLRTDAGPDPVATANSDTLEPDEVVVQFAHHPFLGEWFLQYGRFVGRFQDGQFLTTVQMPTAGSPTVTLDGEVVGMVVGQRPTDPPGTERPPEPAAPTVHTDDTDWHRVVNVPIEDVIALVEASTS